MDIYCDGSCLGNGTENSVGGWAFVYINDSDRVMCGSGSEPYATNNRMELTAFLEAIKANDIIGAPVLNFYLDSAYITNCFAQKWYINWINNGWMNSKNQPVKNQDLWKEIFDLLKNKEYNIIKVKGHSTNKWNNYVDELAVKASNRERSKNENIHN